MDRVGGGEGDRRPQVSDGMLRRSDAGKPLSVAVVVGRTTTGRFIDTDGARFDG